MVGRPNQWGQQAGHSETARGHVTLPGCDTGVCGAGRGVLWGMGSCQGGSQLLAAPHLPLALPTPRGLLCDIRAGACGRGVAAATTQTTQALSCLPPPCWAHRGDRDFGTFPPFISESGATPAVTCDSKTQKEAGPLTELRIFRCHSHARKSPFHGVQFTELCHLPRRLTSSVSFAPK